MLLFFRQIRRQLLTENKFSRYLFYAVGEVLLVVIGILIALQVDSWNRERISLQEEITILRNVKEDIMLDTLDISYNLQYHQKFQDAEQDLLEYLLGTTGSPDDINGTFALGVPLWTALHRSTYENLQNNDVGLLQNNQLRKDIARFYDFYYSALEKMHNEFNSFDLYGRKLPFFRRYFSVIPDSVVVVLDFSGGDDYFEHDLFKKALRFTRAEEARADAEFAFVLNECFLFRKAMIDFNRSVLNEVRQLSITIDLELEKLEK